MSDKPGSPGLLRDRVAIAIGAARRGRQGIAVELAMLRCHRCARFPIYLHSSRKADILSAEYPVPTQGD